MADREFNRVKIKVDFNETANRQQISSGDNLNTLFGKIRKWFSDLKAVAFSGNYNDLLNKPEIPAVGNGKITINQAGVKKGEFTANQSSDVSVDLDGGSNISLTNNLLATVPGVSALDAAVGPVIDGMITALNNDLGIATRQNPNDPAKAQWRLRGSSGEWQNFCSAQSFTVNLTAGYAQSQTLAFSSSVKFQNAKIKVNIRSFSSSWGGGYLSVNVDSKITTIKSTGNYNFEGNVITITANRDASGHTDVTCATLDIEVSN